LETAKRQTLFALMQYLLMQIIS